MPNMVRNSCEKRKKKKKTESFKMCGNYLKVIINDADTESREPFRTKSKPNAAQGAGKRL